MVFWLPSPELLPFGAVRAVPLFETQHQGVLWSILWSARTGERGVCLFHFCLWHPVTPINILSTPQTHWSWCIGKSALVRVIQSRATRQELRHNGVICSGWDFRVPKCLLISVALIKMPFERVKKKEGKFAFLMVALITEVPTSRHDFSAYVGANVNKKLSNSKLCSGRSKSPLDIVITLWHCTLR